MPGTGSVAIFDRDPVGGAITQQAGQAACISDTGDAGACVDGRALAGAFFVNVSPDGRKVYVSANGSDAVSVYAREPAATGGDGGTTIDIDPPQTTITKAPGKKLEKARAKFKFSSDEVGSTFQCRAKGKGVKKALKKFGSCSSPFTLKKLKLGKFKFKVRATDASGNVDPTPAVARFKRVEEA